MDEVISCKRLLQYDWGDKLLVGSCYFLEVTSAID